MVDLVHSRDSKYLRIRFKFFSPSQSLDQCIIGGGGIINSLGIYTLLQCFREVFFIHLMEGDVLKLMSKEEYSILF